MSSFTRTVEHTKKNKRFTEEIHTPFRSKATVACANGAFKSHFG